MKLLNTKSQLQHLKPQPITTQIHQYSRAWMNLLEQIVANNIMAQSATGTQNKRSFENRCNPTFQTLILTASAKKSDSIPTKPAATSMVFFEQKNAAEAKAFVFNKLNIVENLPIYIPSDLITAIWSGVVFWDYLGTPSYFSFFLVPHIPPTRSPIQQTILRCPSSLPMEKVASISMISAG